MKYIVEEVMLTTIADTIRNKTGITGKLTFPDKFLEGIQQIEQTPPTTLPVLDMNYPEDVETILENGVINASFSVVISIPGTPAEYSYQWYLDGEPLEGATSAVLTKKDYVEAGNHNIYCEVTNEAGAVTSRVAKLTVCSVPVLDVNYPQDVTVTLKDGKINATFNTVIVTPGVPAEYTYQWYLDGNLVQGASGAVFTKNDSISAGEHSVYCEITNKAGTISTRVAKLTVYSLPVLNGTYPADVSIVEKANGSATFNVIISEHGNPNEYTYQWYVNSSAVSGATNSSYTKTGLTSAATYTVYCEVSNNAGIVTSRVATLKVTSSKPVYSYNGTSEIIQDSTYNWRIKFKTSGTLRFTSLGCMANGIDLFLVGGGGGGGGWSASGGGGGGRTKTVKGMTSIVCNKDYPIVIGAGGAGKPASDGGAGAAGGSSSAFGNSISGGNGGNSHYINDVGSHGGEGGAGGSGGGSGGWDGTVGAGGSNGGNGGRGYNKDGGAGQGTTTREFGENSGTLYAGGGGGRHDTGAHAAGGAGGGGKGTVAGTVNTGGGGGGGANGGSGIVVIRNAR